MIRNVTRKFWALISEALGRSSLVKSSISTKDWHEYFRMVFMANRVIEGEERDIRSDDCPEWPPVQVDEIECFWFHHYRDFCRLFKTYGLNPADFSAAEGSSDHK